MVKVVSKIAMISVFVFLKWAEVWFMKDFTVWIDGIEMFEIVVVEDAGEEDDDVDDDEDEESPGNSSLRYVQSYSSHSLQS